MRLKGWMILQAVALEFQGGKFVNTSFGRTSAIFHEKELAREYLRNLIIEIKREQGLGLRSADNLDPKKKLDFYIQSITIEFDEKDILKRGWKLPK